MRDSFESFGRSLVKSRQLADEMPSTAIASGDQVRADRERDKITLWLEPLATRQQQVAETVTRFIELTESDLEVAMELSEQELAPLVRKGTLTLVHDYLLRTEDELTDKLKDIEARSQAAERLDLALALGLLVSRSITGRIVV